MSQKCVLIKSIHPNFNKFPNQLGGQKVWKKLPTTMILFEGRLSLVGLVKAWPITGHQILHKLSNPSVTHSTMLWVFFFFKLKKPKFIWNLDIKMNLILLNPKVPIPHRSSPHRSVLPLLWPSYTCTTMQGSHTLHITQLSHLQGLPLSTCRSATKLLMMFSSSAWSHISMFWFTTPFFSFVINLAIMFIIVSTTM
jgi:hypothetical protein